MKLSADENDVDKGQAKKDPEYLMIILGSKQRLLDEDDETLYWIESSRYLD